MCKSHIPITMSTSSHVIHCAIWRSVHGRISCPTYSVSSQGGWSSSLSRAPGRSGKQFLTNPGSVGSHTDTPQTCILCHLWSSYQPCLMPAAPGMRSQWCYMHESTCLLTKQSTFSGSFKRLHSWENLGLAGKRVQLSFHVVPLNKIQNTNLCRNLVWPLTHKRANHKD